MKTRTGRWLYAPELLESRIAPATFTVTSLADDGTDGTLRKEIADANASPGADKIVFDLANPLDPHLITLNTATGEIPITDPLTIKGPGIDLLTVTGSDMIRIFNINYPADSLVPTVISGLSLIDGKSADRGGAILSREALTLKNVVVASSYAANFGGGVALYAQGKVSIDSCRIVNNEAKNKSGGGLYLAAFAGISIVKSTIADNTAADSGGLYAHIVTGPGAIVLDKLIISGNSATVGSGGGGSLDGQDEGKIVVKNSLITGNTAVVAGGGLYCDNGNLIVKKTTFSRNSAARGGALADSLALSMDISGSRFLANKATDAAGAGGGALYLQGSAVKIAGTLFSGNTSASTGAAAGGGAISTSEMAGEIVLDIKGSSFLGNTTVGNGGAIFLAHKTALTLKGSVLSGNIAGSGGAIEAETGSSVTASGNQFTENKATGGDGGAIHASGTMANAVALTLAGNLFSANLAADGGAVHASGAGAISMKGDKVLGNVADTKDGGGLYLASSTNIVLTGLLVQGNLCATKGGGIRVKGNATITGGKVLDNSASFDTGLGGGIFVESGNVAIARCTVTGNVASIGGGIYGTATTTIPGTKVFGNSARTDPNTHGLP